MLLPRSKADMFPYHPENTRPKKKQQEDNNDLSVHESPLTKLCGDKTKETELIHRLEEEEISLMHALRSENIKNMERDEDMKSGTVPGGSPAVYCFCRKPESGYMLQCELCHEWYHATCLHIPKGKRVPGKDTGKDAHFLCPLCQRTRRPRLDPIVALLISLQKIPVHISEGTAIQCLAERSIAWQKKARQGMQCSVSVLEAAKQQKKRIEEIKNHIARWRQEASTTLSSSTTSIQAQLATSAGWLKMCTGLVGISVVSIFLSIFLSSIIFFSFVPVFIYYFFKGWWVV